MTSIQEDVPFIQTFANNGMLRHSFLEENLQFLLESDIIPLVGKYSVLGRNTFSKIVDHKYDNQFEQVCKSIHCIRMAVLLGCVMLKVSLLRL